MTATTKTGLSLAPALLAGVMVLADGALAAPDGAYLCYKPADNQDVYAWDHSAWWFDSTAGSAATVDRIPASTDHVFLYSSKNHVGGSGKPMVVTNGVNASTGVLEIGDSSHGQNYVIGITVQTGGSMTTHGEALIGNCGGSYTGGGRLVVESGGMWTAKEDFKLGISKGTSWLRIEDGGEFVAEGDFVAGQRYGSGIVTNLGTMSADNLAVGRLGTGLFVHGGTLSVSGALSVGTNATSSGSLELRGGDIAIAGGGSGVWKLFLGSGGSRSTGRTRGWGTVRNTSGTLRMTLYGQVVADGGGVARDLDFSTVKTIGKSASDTLNSCGTNGWYAVSKGRLIYPREQNCNANQASHPTVGDYPSRSEPTAMNSFRYTLATPPGRQYYNFAELYASDRDDIPTGLPAEGGDVVAGVWRIGLSSATGAEPRPISFAGMSVSFRYDKHGMSNDQAVTIYRHSGASGGKWTRASDPVPVAAEGNLLATKAFASSSETWNAGWFAIVAQRPRATVISVH